tara:strand:- start:287 stop:469 length:183 start_codon:yes stop_codon:yes gene_type:complete
MPQLTEREKLLFALTQIDNVVKLTEENEWKNYLYNHLSPIKYELERQLTNLNVYETAERN